jgi:beta-mannosidase
MPVILAFIPDQNDVIISICSDGPDAGEAALYYAIKDFNGNTLEEQVIPSEIDPAKAVIAAKLSKKQIRSTYTTNEIFLEAEIRQGEKILARDVYYFEAAKDLHLPSAKIQSIITRKSDFYEVTLKSENLARNVYLTLDRCEAQFSDNYFDLLPGEAVTVLCKACEDDDSISRELHIKTLNDLLDFNH